jgi:hypothetical protein
MQNSKENISWESMKSNVLITALYLEKKHKIKEIGSFKTNYLSRVAGHWLLDQNSSTNKNILKELKAADINKIKNGYQTSCYLSLGNSYPWLPETYLILTFHFKHQIKRSSKIIHILEVTLIKIISLSLYPQLSITIQVCNDEALCYSLSPFHC